MVFPADVLQVKAFVALADVAPEGVNTFPEPGTHCNSCRTFIHICKALKKKDTGEDIHIKKIMYSSLFCKKLFFRVVRLQLLTETTQQHETLQGQRVSLIQKLNKHFYSCQTTFSPSTVVSIHL